MSKKIMLLTMSVAALAAFAAPSTASAGEWYTNNVKIGPEASKDAVTLVGTLSSTKGGLKSSCDASANVELWNTSGKGHGLVQSLTLSADPTDTGGCTVAANTPHGYTDVTNCHVDATSKNFPWTITTDTVGGSNVVIDNVNFAWQFTGVGCMQHLAIPSGTKVEESATIAGLTGTFLAPSINFNNAGHFAGGTMIEGFLTKAGLEFK